MPTIWRPRVLMATDKPVLVAPAMNPRMWLHPATRRNVAQLAADGIAFVGPNVGEMAERGEAGPGRLAEVPELIEAITALLARPSSCVGSGKGRRPTSPRRPPRAGHQRPDARADRSGALHRQPLLGQAGFGHRRRGRGARARASRW